MIRILSKTSASCRTFGELITDKHVKVVMCFNVLRGSGVPGRAEVPPESAKPCRGSRSVFVEGVQLKDDPTICLGPLSKTSHSTSGIIYIEILVLK